EAQSAARKRGEPVWLAEMQEREKELHWVLSKEAWDKDPRVNRAQADKAWSDLVQLPTPERATEIVIHHLANQADIAAQAVLLAGQYVAKVWDFNQDDERPDFQILDLKDRIGAASDRILDDQAALWRKLQQAVAGTRGAEGGATERAAGGTDPAATAHSTTEQLRWDRAGRPRPESPSALLGVTAPGARGGSDLPSSSSTGTEPSTQVDPD